MHKYKEKDIKDMKVLQLGKCYPIIGGVEKTMLDLTIGLSSRGIECDMLCANANIGTKGMEKQLNEKSRIIALRTWKKSFATMLCPSMVQWLRKNCRKYDIIHVHHPDPMAALALWLSGYKGKVVLHWHSDILKQKNLLKLYMPLQNWLKRRASLIVGTTPVYVAQSPHLADVQNKVTYLPIGIQAVEHDNNKAHKIKELYPDKKIVFSLGRLVHYKGYTYLIDAALHLPDSYVILIGGSGALRTQLQQQIDGHHLGNKVKLLGRVADEELCGYYQACDVFCLSSIQKTEAFAIVQVEAMSCSKPVVATNIPESGVSWVNAHGKSGINVEIENGKALAEAIIAVTKDKDAYTRYAQGAKQRYESTFRYETMMDRCISLYKEV